MQEAGSQVKGEFPYLLMFQTGEMFQVFLTGANDTLFRLEREQSSPLSRQSHGSGQRTAVSRQLFRQSGVGVLGAAGGLLAATGIL
jgi:hypothetical protein